MVVDKVVSGGNGSQYDDLSILGDHRSRMISFS